ncbi:MAG: hypothetical protein IT563_18085 [Alphaproteobacteria bacterium]|nr:hypothetical protein [Alphaproteobacteria bacterium]
MQHFRRAAAAFTCALAFAGSALAFDGIVEKKTFAMPAYTEGKTVEYAEIDGPNGHLNGVLHLAKQGDLLKAFLSN